MKLTLIATLLTGFLGLGAGMASADPYYGPPGEAPIAGQPVAQPPQPDYVPVRQQVRQPPRNGELRHALMDRFDRNHDGRLEPRERRQAARALRKMARKLAKQERRQMRAQRQQMRAQRGQQSAGGPNVDVYVD
jgi:hypothetical protein